MSEAVRTALVTGGARRVGRAIVQRLLEAGFDVAFTYLRSDEGAAAIAADARRLGREALALRTDLRRTASAVERIGNAVERRFDRLDVLVNNASIYQPGPLQQVTSRQVREMFAIHVEAPLLLCRRLERMLRRSSGHVINMVDIMAARPRPEYLAYCASKAALANLTAGLARALAPEVTVNGIAPGVVEWPEGCTEQQRRSYLEHVPLKRAGTPRDVAELVLFLCTAGRYISGQVIALDGGRSIA